MANPKKMARALLALTVAHLLAAPAASRSSSSGGVDSRPFPPLTTSSSSAAAAAATNAGGGAAGSIGGSVGSPFAPNDASCFPGLECPRFDLLEVAPSYQVRRYEPAAWAATVVRHAPSLQAAQLVGLSRLARFWAHNDRGRALALTSPLVTALFPTKGGGDGWSVKGVFVVAAPLPRSDAHFPPRPLEDGDPCPWGDPDARRGEKRACRVRVFRSGVEGGCRRRNNEEDGDASFGEEQASWLSGAVETLLKEEEGGGDGEEAFDDPPCFLDGPNGDCSQVDEGEPSKDDPNHRRRRHRRHRDRGTVVYASSPFDGFPTEGDALRRARELRLALHADFRPYCRRVFFLSVYSPAWQLILRKNEVWVPSCARRSDDGGDGGDGRDGGGGGPAAVAAS